MSKVENFIFFIAGSQKFILKHIGYQYMIFPYYYDYFQHYTHLLSSKFGQAQGCIRWCRFCYKRFLSLKCLSALNILNKTWGNPVYGVVKIFKRTFIWSDLVISVPVISSVLPWRFQNSSILCNNSNLFGHNIFLQCSS